MRLLGVTEDDEFGRQAQAIIPDAKLRDEVLSAAYSLLAYYPQAGRSLGYDIRRLVYDIPPLRVTVVILYTVDQHRVTLHEIFEHR